MFIDVPDKILYERLIKRGESPERAKVRIDRGSTERKYKHLYHACIENIELDKAVAQVEKLIDKEIKKDSKA